MKDRPQYIIVAGVNGAGKSTLYQTVPQLFQDTQRINADEILNKNGGDWRKNSDNMKAMREVVKQMNQAIESKRSFHQETTLSGQGQKKWIEKAKAQGYEVNLFYVGIDNADLAIQRVKQRVEKGGHGIPDELIKKRYSQSLKNLEYIAPLCDNVMLYDNTKIFVPIYERQGEKIVLNNTKNIKWLPVSFINKYRVGSRDMANITDFTEKQFEDRLEKNVERLTKNRLAVESPTAFLLGGQPGSGKTSLRSAISEETQENVVIIDNDTFKQQHPNFDELVKLYEKDVVKHVTPYSNRMTEAIISRLSDQGYNLVIEGTGRTTDVPIQTATMLQAKGYETKMYVMAVPKIESYLGTIERYETMYADDPMTARATPKQAHDIVVKNLPTNLETLHKTGLFSDIRLYNREGVKLYSSLETPSISPKETLERELNRKVSGKEIQPTLERIEQKMVQNQHQETPEFKAIQQKLESLQPPTPPIPKIPKLPGL